MADTRCVNPEYQLDVDLMILEYLLHHALRSFFDSTKLQSSSVDGLHGASSRRLVEDGTVLSMFDSFMQVFRLRHPDYDLGAGTNLNIRLLETVLLLRGHEDTTTAHSATEEQPVINSQSLQYEEWHHQLRERESWHRRQAKSEYHQGDEADIEKENYILLAWSDYQSAAERDDAPQHPPSPLFGVLYLFMALSAEIGHIMGCINENLMQLACDTMLQTSLDVLSTPRRPYRDPEDVIPGMSTYNHYVVPTLGHIFAYGYVPNFEQTPASNDDLDLTSQMLSETIVNSKENTSVTVEKPEWTIMRHATILEFQIPLRSLHDHTAYSARLTRLKQKYPYPEFRTKLVRCLEHFWNVNQDPSVSGLPVLVQIENRGLNGLTEEEFEALLINCGIKRDDKGKLIVGLNLEGSSRGPLFP